MDLINERERDSHFTTLLLPRSCKMTVKLFLLVLTVCWLGGCEAEFSTLIGPGPSRYCAMIG